MSTTVEKTLANSEEIRPRPQTDREDLPLVLFTLLGQMAVGGVWAMAWMFSSLWSLVEYDAMPLRLLPTLLLCICLGAGMLASLTHLGTRKNAWRVFSNLKHSSLSKEVLYTGLFGLGLLLVLLSMVFRQNFYIPILIAGAAGLGLVYNMAEVYRFPAAPGWNTWRTNAGFLVSATLLGIAAMTPLLAYEIVPDWNSGSIYAMGRHWHPRSNRAPGPACFYVETRGNGLPPGNKDRIYSDQPGTGCSHVAPFRQGCSHARHTDVRVCHQ